MASPNMAKLKDMVHSIVASVSAEQLGMTKLNTILWFSDREAFLKFGATLSGDTYIRRPKGPVSASLDDAISSLKKEAVLSVSEQQGEPKHLFHSLIEPTATHLSLEELQLINNQIDRIKPLTADEASELSCDYTWRIYDDDEEIDIVSVLARPGEITAEGLAWAKSVL